MDSRPRANTLGIDSGNMFQRTRKVSGGGHVYEDVNYVERPQPKAPAIADEASAMAVPRIRSRTVAVDSEGGRPRSALAMGRPGSALLMEPPDSPSVAGLRGRHRLQQRESHSRHVLGRGTW
ncbi:hypothetical protein H4R22_005181, partial [Coemansia sp. RSA 1290]